MRFFYNLRKWLTCSLPRGDWIAIFDLNVSQNSPAGSCVQVQVYGLSHDYDITVFSDIFENERPETTRWVRVPLPRKPGVLRYVCFHVLAPVYFIFHCFCRGSRPLLIQTTQGQFLGSDISYAHFCHKAYLSKRWFLQESRGLLRAVRWLGYQYNVYSERETFKTSSIVVVPSHGLALEVLESYPFLEGRVFEIPNPINIERFAIDPGFQRSAFRLGLGFMDADLVIAFAALGDFSRKGLGVILDALSELEYSNIKLLIVGGQEHEIRQYAKYAEQLQVSDRVNFVGFRADVVPYFWCSDLFVFPSSYETFSLVVCQALASGLPVITTRLHGVEEYVVHGENGWIIERSVESLASVLLRLLVNRQLIDVAAKKAPYSVSKFDTLTFVSAWKAAFQKVLRNQFSI